MRVLVARERHAAVPRVSCRRLVHHLMLVEARQFAELLVTIFTAHRRPRRRTQLVFAGIVELRVKALIGSLY